MEKDQAEVVVSSACSGTAWLDGDHDGGGRRPNGGQGARVRVWGRGERGESSAGLGDALILELERGGAGRSEEEQGATARPWRTGRHSGFTVPNRKKPLCENPLDSNF